MSLTSLSSQWSHSPGLIRTRGLGKGKGKPVDEESGIAFFPDLPYRQPGVRPISVQVLILAFFITGLAVDFSSAGLAAFSASAHFEKESPAQVEKGLWPPWGELHFPSSDSRPRLLLAQRNECVGRHDHVPQLRREIVPFLPLVLHFLSISE